MSLGYGVGDFFALDIGTDALRMIELSVLFSLSSQRSVVRKLLRTLRSTVKIQRLLLEISEEMLLII